MKRLLALPLLLISTSALAEEIGECRFDRETLSFAGTPLEQATCLLRKIELRGEKKPQKLPKVLVRLMQDGGTPGAEQKSAAIAAFQEPYRAYALLHADAPVSQTQAGLPLAYFAIHDTSTPFYANEPFPRRLDRDPRVNSFEPYLAGGIAREPVAHIFLNRYGQIWPGHEFAEGWRATKLESRVVGPAARGRFVHIETVQPRRFLPGATTRKDTYGPKPGFTGEQYRQLAALYVYTSARAGRWLIPGFHAAIDGGIPEAHDDPQNFDLKRFGREVETILRAAKR
ncbi:MAG: hypothetical protein RL702_1432 [Pseudomonadota bacterium]|jgi:hypothetical protein